MKERTRHVIDLYTWFTPNGRKVSLMLEECGLDYTAHAVNIAKDEQFAPDFLKISPNNKIPAIVDNDNGKSLMESGAIMMYLADKTGKFWPSDPENKWATVEWLMFQVGGVGPMFGQCHHFTKYNPGKAPYAEERYHNETKRLYGVMNERLGKSGFLACDEYTIADMAVWPWVARFDWQSVDLNEFPNVRRWYLEILDRPATRRGWNVPENEQEIPMP
jgi:GST-like protein